MFFTVSLIVLRLSLSFSRANHICSNRAETFDGNFLRCVSSLEQSYSLFLNQSWCLVRGSFCFFQHDKMQNYTMWWLFRKVGLGFNYLFVSNCAISFEDA